MFSNLDLTNIKICSTEKLFPQNKHPRAVIDNPFAIRQIKQLRVRGLEYLKEEIPLLDYDSFSEYWKNGERIHYEASYFNRRRRLIIFSILAWAEPEKEEWLHALNEDIWQICSEPFWTIPPHFFGYSHEEIPFSMYYNQLDLCSCDTAYALTEVMALLGERLPYQIKEQIKLNVQRRVLDTWLNPERKFFFEHFPNNWASVCPSCIAGAALQLLSDGPKLRQILLRSLKCIDIYLSSFGEDGVCLEGAGYFSYGFGMFTCFSELLYERTEGQLDLFRREPKLAKIARVQSWYYVSGNQSVNFSDCSDDQRCYLGISQYLYEKTGAEIPPAAADILNDVGDKYCIALRDILWTEVSHTEKPQLVNIEQETSVKWFENAQWFLSRGKHLAFAAKGGQNGSGGNTGYEGYEQFSHGHNDCGSFILYSDGMSCLCDLGGQKYNADYFSEKRYDFLAVSSRSHNVPIVNGCLQMIGSTCSAKDLRVRTKGANPFFQLDISACYGGKENGIKSLVRCLQHNIETDTLTLYDSLVLDDPGVLCENFCGKEEIKLLEDGAVFSRKGSHIVMKYNTEDFKAEIITEQYDTGSLNTVWFLRVTSKENAVNHVFQADFYAVPKSNTLSHPFSS